MPNDDFCVWTAAGRRDAGGAALTAPHSGLAAIRAAVGDAWSDDAATLAPHLIDWRGRVRGTAAMMVWPGSTAEVAAVVRAAAAAQIPLVPHGGNTGLAGGAIPDPSGEAVIVGLQRLATIAPVDMAGQTVTVGAGVVLVHVHAAAAAAGMVFPLDLAAKGSATVGGLVATNAGGVQVLRHGTMRARVAGLEAVLADGSVLDQLSPLVKDTGGYDIKQLLIGSEGTLGIVTRVCLRLAARPQTRVVAWAGMASPAAALALLARLRGHLGDVVESFELMPLGGVDLVVAQGLSPPLATRAPWQVLIEVATTRVDPGLADALAYALGEVDDAVIAQSGGQADALWRLREMLPEAERRDGVAVKHDIAVPVAALPAFVAATSPAIEAAWPGSRVLAFGHVGDGNLHFNVRAPAGADSAAWVDRFGPEVTRAVNDRVVAMGGTIAAEHGIGSVKAGELARLGNPARLAAMRAIKAALDPAGIMNPGKVVTR